MVGHPVVAVGGRLSLLTVPTLPAAVRSSVHPLPYLPCLPLQSDKKFLQNLENGVRFGKWILLENVSEKLDAALEPILLQQKFKQGGCRSMFPYMCFPASRQLRGATVQAKLAYRVEGLLVE